ncbi:initiation factor IF-2 [Candidatus Saccharimonas aalborgensis]|jgi:translation initiation factor IF-2|uniref:Translation initiation factor IF-2 n=1 Tax=Candidatus Saccharimonas aalborgensis TaxID=1332188 RepID=R4PVX1_9BACT|nr:translation initiation factor IF-2 [Candidatus Saccharimonas aalborgensis]AGL62405.1 initiation factor IF-2 [Candidatus Saccharimonas aalborgensis]MBP7775360.1 translation initiation factor IF-2 [Candidatus Saccharimonas sp.]QQR51155.1 MAG: translation initiation factor IF-2 [Candidatus Saccharibacteria bacterium]QQS70248.1 MAG: translation initiation factor IF-2 [Candidatus Saccharibacteria bacterium]
MSQPEKKTLIIADSITVGELAETLNLPVTQLVGELFKNGIVATINQRIDFETATIIVGELGLDVELQRKQVDTTAVQRLHTPSERAVDRPPIVAVMGHVDHGKTSLLDAILSTKTVAGEAGGITQHISAYQTVRNNRPITLLDTPGHEAFAALRQHGATLTDVVVIVVAADDGVKPQTIEAIRFARTANAKIVVAINKIDKEAANVDMVKAQLASEHQLNPEEWGGDTVMVPVSAKTREGLDKLLDMVLLVADMEELRADVDVPAEGLVIEAHMETGRGSVVGLLVEQGMLKPGHFLVAGISYGKVRTLLDFAGKPLKSAGPSTPVTVTGFKVLPQFGDVFTTVKNEREARLLVERARQEAEKFAASTNVTGADLLKLMTQKHDTQELNVIVKADVQGSLTSVMDSLRMVDTGGEVNLRIIGSGVGNITENDVRLAGSSSAIIYGFNIELPPAVKRLAARDKVEVRLYKVIYELLDDARNTIERLLVPEVVETEVGTMTLKGIFRTVRDEVICGGEVTHGKVTTGLLVRAKHAGDQLAEVEVVSVQRQQQEAKEVFEGEMCGLSLKTHKKLSLEIGDTLEFFTRELVKRTLK